jgi:hypothetical protein
MDGSPRLRPAIIITNVQKRLCYIHVGPHKTGTTSIQWFLQENREEFVKHGYFVPEAERRRGAHHALAEHLCGLDVGEHREPLVTKFTQALGETSCEAIIISSEALEGFLESKKHAAALFSRVRELNLEPKVILFPRNQPQWINSSYASSVKGFRRSDPFESCGLGFAESFGSRFSRWSALADTYAFELIARPFTKQTIRSGVIQQFLDSVGINPEQFQSREIRRNEGVGPFTVSVARDVMRSLGETAERLTWLQATRCHLRLAEYLRNKRLADAGYCGLTTALARRIEEELRSDNDAFAQRVWGRPWAEVFSADTAQEFMPNDFQIRRPNWSTARRLRRAIREMKEIVHRVLVDPAFAVQAPWNDLRQRSGLV